MDVKRIDPRSGKAYKFAVVRTAFHGGGIVSMHTTYDLAHKASVADRSSSCACGCNDIVPIDLESQKELNRMDFDVPLLDELPCYDPSFGPYTLCI